MTFFPGHSTRSHHFHIISFYRYRHECLELVPQVLFFKEFMDHVDEILEGYWYDHDAGLFQTILCTDGNIL